MKISQEIKDKVKREFIASSAKIGIEIVDPGGLYDTIWSSYKQRNWANLLCQLIKSQRREELDDLLLNQFNFQGKATGRFLEIIKHFPEYGESKYIRDIRESY